MRNLATTTAIQEGSEQLPSGTAFLGAEQRDGRESRSDEELVERRQKLLEQLTSLGIWRQRDGIAVVDIERLQKLKFGNRSLSKEKEVENIGFSKSEFLHLLQDEYVVSLGEYESAREGYNVSGDSYPLSGLGKKQGSPKNFLTPKRLFYLPDSEEHAFDAEYITEQQDKHYLNFWDFGFNKKWDDRFALADGSSIRLDELYLSKMIFGELGYRDGETGKIVVFDNDGNERPFSANWFANTYGDVGGSEDNVHTFRNSPLDYLRRSCPRLLSAGLFRSEDFRADTESVAGRTFRREVQVSEKGTFYLAGARYSLGKQFAGMTVSPLAEGKAALLKDSDDPAKSYVLFLATVDEMEEKLGEVGDKSRVSFPRRLGEHIFPYMDKMKDESAGEYRARQDGFVGFRFIHELSNEIALSSGVGMHGALTWPEQVWVGKTVVRAPEQKEAIIAGTERYGTNFLRTFFASAHGEDVSGDILALTDKKQGVPQTLGVAVFAKYAELVDAAEEVARATALLAEKSDKRPLGLQGDKVGEVATLSEEVKEKVWVLLQERAKRVLVDAARECAATHDASERFHKARGLIDNLRAIKKDLVVLAAVVKVRSAEPDFDVSEVEGVEVRTVRGGSAEAATHREAMERIFRANWAHKEKETVDEISATFREAIADPSQRFHLLVCKNKNTGAEQLAAFVRFTKLPNGSMYAGSYNVDPAVRGYKLGPALFDSLLEREAKHGIVEAVSMPDQPMLPTYVNKNGFLIDGVSEGESHWQFHLRRDDKRRERLHGPNLTGADILRVALLENAHEGDLRDYSSPWPGGGWEGVGFRNTNTSQSLSRLSHPTPALPSGRGGKKSELHNSESHEGDYRVVAFNPKLPHSKPPTDLFAGGEVVSRIHRAENGVLYFVMERV